MAIKRINVPNGTSGLSFRNVQSGQSQSSQASRQTQRTRDVTSQNQNAAYQINFAPRSFFIEDDFNDITIEELAQFMERDDDFVEETTEESNSANAQAQPEPVPDQPVDQRKVAAVAAYDWFATL